MRSVVVLPQPEGPSREKNAPRGTSSETSATARWEANRLVTCRSSRTALTPLILRYH